MSSGNRKCNSGGKSPANTQRHVRGSSVSNKNGRAVFTSFQLIHEISYQYPRCARGICDGLNMPVNWEQFKGVIVELYIRRGYTLETVKETMSVEHGVNAS
jgi:hypothetical protein